MHSLLSNQLAQDLAAERRRIASARRAAAHDVERRRVQESLLRRPV